jgi:hypothetical protein
MKIRESLLLVTIVAASLVLGVTFGGEASYSFSLDRVDGTTVWLESDKECKWGTVSYSGGPFIVTDDGVETARRDAESAIVSGLILRLNESSGALEVTCRAPKCAISTRAGIHALTHGKSVRITASSGVKFIVWRAPVRATST